MPLITIWQKNPNTVKKFSIEQVVATAGDGHLTDSSECKTELQAFLQEVSVDDLARYADHCLIKGFNKSGYVLQDIINELGRRLEYDVTNGRYHGVANDIGFDGIWKNSEGGDLVVEAKTTDAYRLSLDKLAVYRQKLLKAEQISQDCSILIVVGRTDTGELEAQVRGSRHAWDMRLISVDSLLNLVRIKESADSQETVSKIKKLLTPIEYTRIDELVDVVFTAAKDVETSVESETGEKELLDSDVPQAKQGYSQEVTPSEVLQEKRNAIVQTMGKKLGTNLVKKSRATYWNSDHTTRLACAISKRYTNQGARRYWYAYHPSWDNFLDEGDRGLFALGCVDLDVVFAIPLQVIQEHLDSFYTTEKKDGKGHYYHIVIQEPETGKYSLQLPKKDSNLPLNEYLVELNA